MKDTKEAPPPRSQRNSVEAAAYTIPTDLVDLPSRGKFYPKGHPLHKVDVVEVRYMTTKEEDVLLNQSFIEKGIVLDKLIENILVNKNIDVSTLLLGDKNAIIINARKNAYGEKYTFSYMCVNCYAENEHTTDLSKLDYRGSEDIQFTDNGTFFIDLPVSKASLEVGLLTTKDEIEIGKKMQQKTKHGLASEPTVERYRKIIKSINGEQDPLVIANFVSNMPIRDSRALTKMYIKHNPDVDFVYENSCTNCGNVNKGGVPLTGNFFWLDD
jgi:hypothetical protein